MSGALVNYNSAGNTDESGHQKNAVGKAFQPESGKQHQRYRAEYDGK